MKNKITMVKFKAMIAGGKESFTSLNINHIEAITLMPGNFDAVKIHVASGKEFKVCLKEYESKIRDYLL